MENTLINLDFENILATCRNMIYSIINETKNDFLEVEFPVCDEDLYQEGCIALYEAYKNYHESNAKFTTFAYLVIKRRIKHKFREYVRPLLHERYSYDAVRQLDYYSCYNKNNKQTNRTDNETINHFLSTLNITDARIIESRINGLTYQKIANNLNIKTKQVEYRLKKAKEKFKDYLIKNDLN